MRTGVYYCHVPNPEFSKR